MVSFYLRFRYYNLCLSALYISPRSASVCLFISLFTNRHTGAPASACVCAHSLMVFWEYCATGANRAWHNLCGSLIYLVPVVTLQIDEDNEFDPPSPSSRWFCQALPFSPTPKYKLQVHTTAHGQVSCCQNPVWSTHADRYYNMLHSVPPAKSRGILKWDTSLQCLRYVKEQMIHPGKKIVQSETTVQQDLLLSS